MEQYVKYLRKSRFDRDYAELSVEETLKRHEAILDKIVQDRGYYVAKTYYEVVSGESIAARPEIQKMLEAVRFFSFLPQRLSPHQKSTTQQMSLTKSTLSLACL